MNCEWRTAVLMALTVLMFGALACGDESESSESRGGDKASGAGESESSESRGGDKGSGAGESESSESQGGDNSDDDRTSVNVMPSSNVCEEAARLLPELAQDCPAFNEFLDPGDTFLDEEDIVVESLDEEDIVVESVDCGPDEKAFSECLVEHPDAYCAWLDDPSFDNAFFDCFLKSSSDSNNSSVREAETSTDGVRSDGIDICEQAVSVAVKLVDECGGESFELDAPDSGEELQCGDVEQAAARCLLDHQSGFCDLLAEPVNATAENNAFLNCHATDPLLR